MTIKGRDYTTIFKKLQEKLEVQENDILSKGIEVLEFQTISKLYKVQMEKTNQIIDSFKVKLEKFKILAANQTTVNNFY